MKILQITRQYQPSIGGIENAVQNISLELQNQGYDVAVLTLNRIFRTNEILPASEIIDGIKVIRIPFFGNSRYAIAANLLRYIKDYDILHVHSTDFFLDFLAISKFFHRKKIILHSHGFYFHSDFANNCKKIYFKTITKFSCNFVDKIICVSQKDYCLAKEIIPEHKLRMIHNGISKNHISINSLTKRKNYEIVSVGRLSKNKQYDLLIRTIAKISQDISNLQLTIIGKDQGELKNLRNLIIDLQLENIVKLTEEIDDEQLIWHLHKSTIWTSASNYESFGIGLLEGMANGCIPIISDIPAFSELIQNKSNGFLVNFNNKNEVLETFKKVINMTNEEKEKIQKNNALLLENYHWDNKTKEIADIYHQV